MWSWFSGLGIFGWVILAVALVLIFNALNGATT